MANNDTARGFTAGVAPGESPNDSNLSPVAEAIVDKQRRAQATRAAVARNANGRRRFVDPTTCEKDYNEAEMEFMKAMQIYKQASGRSFPTWSKVLEVVKGLGYEKVGPYSV